MSLRRRLSLFFVLIVILPLTAAGFVVQRVVIGEVEDRDMLSLRPTVSVAVASVEDRLGKVRKEVATFARSGLLARALGEKRQGRLERLLSRDLKPDGLDFLVAVDGRGRIVGKALRSPAFAPGNPVAGPRRILDAPAPVQSGFAKSPVVPVAVPGRRAVGSVIGGFWVDRDVLVGSIENRVELAVVVHSDAVAATEPLSGPVPVSIGSGPRFGVDIGGAGTAVARRIGPGMALIAWAPASTLERLRRHVLESVAALLLVALVASTLVANLLARLVTRPLAELSTGAKAIAEGRFGHRISVRSQGEIGELAEAFNEMSERLSETVNLLSSSREQLHKAVRRMGETLRSTHDMEQILDSILNTAADSIQADAAILWRFSSTRAELYPAITREVGGEVPNIPVGSGIAGLVAERATPLLKTADEDDIRHSAEPYFPVAVAAPLYTRGRIQAVVVAYRRDESHPFSKEDLGTVVFLAEQGGVAMENVALHEEARRLSLTDGLTGVWNRRYFQMQFRQVLATASRFDRPFSVVMMDLDHFKKINDTHGHRRGDEILLEFARRVSGVLREVDTFARYGGEEFICLLSETDSSGASTTSEKIMDVVKSEPFGEPGEPPVELTVSLGIASYPRNGSAFSSLVQAADEALYKAKQEGRDRAEVAGETVRPLKVAR